MQPFPGIRALAVLLAVTAGPAAAQRGWDAQVHALALARDSTMVAGGAGAGWRVGRGLRLAATVSAGVRTLGGAVGRAEALLAYHVSPPRPGGVGVYVAAGVAGEMYRGDVRGLIAALIGVEARPWNGGGWILEVGMGGGVRVAAGYRLIRLARRR